MRSSPLRTVLVDDEPVARRILEEELAAIPDLAIVGQADNGGQAVEVIAELRPDLVLLDIQMPVCDGFEVVRRLSPLPVSVVFVTAFDRHALRAFEVGAADYLLKPIRQERLLSTIERVRGIAARNPMQTAQTLARTLDAAAFDGSQRVAGKRSGEYFLLEVNDVLAFRAEGELVWIITRQRRYLASQTLQELAARFAGAQFRRIHRGTLINLNHVRKMSRLSSQRWLLTLSNDMEVIVSKRQAYTIREVIHA